LKDPEIQEEIEIEAKDLLPGDFYAFEGDVLGLIGAKLDFLPGSRSAHISAKFSISFGCSITLFFEPGEKIVVFRRKV